MDATAHTFDAPGVRCAWLIRRVDGLAPLQSHIYLSSLALHRDLPDEFYPSHRSLIFQVAP